MSTEYQLGLRFGHGKDAASVADRIWSFGGLTPLGAPAHDDRTGRQGVADVPGWGAVECSSYGVLADGTLDLAFGLSIYGLAAADARVAETLQGWYGSDVADEQLAELERSWRLPLDRWLAGLGQFVHATHPFVHGWIGQEIFVRPNATDEAPDSPLRWVTHLVPNAGSDDLRVLPATRFPGGGF